jgi:hypoxanthine-DNA glycosylase
MARVINSLEPIIDRNSRVLILGTMPGHESLAKGEYYANPRNQFWKIIYQMLGETDEPPGEL